MTLKDQDPDEDGGVPLPRYVPFDEHYLIIGKPSKKPTESEHHTETMAEKEEKPMENRDRICVLFPQLSDSAASELGPLQADSPGVLQMPNINSFSQAYRSRRSIPLQQSFQQTQQYEILPSVEIPRLPTTVKQYDTPQPASRHSSPSRHVNESSLPPKKLVKPSLEFSPVSLPAPQPTHEYVIQAFLEARKLSQPQSFLIILDLNGTLLKRSRAASGASMVFRPFLQEFLQYCLGNHNVMVWSSVTPKNLEIMCSKIFSRSQRKRLLGEWGRDTLDLTKSEYEGKTQVYKRMDKIWQNAKLQSLHPYATDLGRWSQKNTVLIDDSVIKAKAQPFNHIEVPEFTRSPHQHDGTDVLSQVVAYLEELRKWDDVSRFIHGNPFRVDQGWLWDWKSDKAAV